MHKSERITDSKKHPPERIVPINGHFPSGGCVVLTELVLMLFSKNYINQDRSKQHKQNGAGEQII